MFPTPTSPNGAIQSAAIRLNELGLPSRSGNPLVALFPQSPSASDRPFQKEAKIGWSSSCRLDIINRSFPQIFIAGHGHLNLFRLVRLNLKKKANVLDPTQWMPKALKNPALIPIMFIRLGFQCPFFLFNNRLDLADIRINSWALFLLFCR
jgi:hypothetical protein